MRGGARIGCLVNGAAGRETLFARRATAARRAHRRDRRRTGRAHLCVAGRRWQQVTVFEKDKRPGGAFRYAGKAPLFQEVEANQGSFERYIADIATACERHGVRFRYASDIAQHPIELESFDRIVIASGAKYRHRWLGVIATWMLEHGLARAPGIARLFRSPKVRNWFYYQARVATGMPLRALAQPGQKVIVIGDALHAGKSKDAIASAFAAALLPHKIGPLDLGPVED